MGRRPPRGTPTLAQVKAMMRAILGDAIRSYERLAARRSRTGGQNRRLKELRQWFQSDEVDYVFEFRCICETLGLDTDCVRRRVLSENTPDTDCGDAQQ